MFKIIRILKDKFPALFLLFISSTWILLYINDGIISLGDFIFPIQPWKVLYIRLYAWKEFFFLGQASPIDFVNIVHYLPIFILSKIGVPLNYIQSLFFIFLFFTASYSFYLLIREILGRCYYRNWIALVAANFYIFNPYMEVIKLKGYNISLYIYAFAPLILYLFHRYLQSDSILKNKYLFLLGVAFTLSNPGNTQPAYTVWFISILFLYLFFILLFQKKDVVFMVKSFIVVFLFLLLNAFWIIPTLFSGFFSTVILISNSIAKSGTSFSGISGDSAQSLAGLFRLLGMTGMTAAWRGLPYTPYFKVYFSPLFIILSFLIIIFALSSTLFVFKKGANRDSFWGRYFITIFLFSVFFIGGTVVLLPEIKVLLYEKFSLLMIFRKPYEKIGFFFIFSLFGLLALSLKTILGFIGHQGWKYKQIVSLIIILLILLIINIYSFPFWTKQIFTSINHPECTVRGINHYPEHYYQLGEYFEKDRLVGRILGLPVNNSPVNSGVENYKWGYAGFDPVYAVVNTGYVLLNPLLPFYDLFFEKVNSKSVIQEEYIQNLERLTGLFGVKKLLLRRDLCWELYGSPNPKKDQQYLQSWKGSRLQLGELDLISLPEDNFIPHFYSPNRVIKTDLLLNNIFQLVTQSSSSLYSIYFTEQNKKKLETIETNFPEGEMRNRPVLEYKRIDPTKYRIRVHRVKSIFPLVFSQGFDEGWKAYLVGGRWTVDGGQWSGSGNIDIYGQSGRKQISEIGSLAIGDDARKKDLHSYQDLSERGNLWDNFSITTSSSFHRSQYSRGIREGIRQGLHPISLSSSWQSDGSENYNFDLSGYRTDKKEGFSGSFTGFRSFIPEIKLIDTVSAQDISQQSTVNSLLSSYKILDGNEEDQATKEETEKFIENGWVTTLGDGKEKKTEHKKYENGKDPSAGSGQERLDYVEKYKIDFVSKNFQDTIQNDNLPSGPIWETWLARKLESYKVGKFIKFNRNVVQIPDENHLMVNGYANSWIIDPNEVCNNSEIATSPTTPRNDKAVCIKNPDGTYDMELVVEFWPQRLFYLGAAISLSTLIGCLIYLGYDWRKNRSLAAKKTLLKPIV